MTPDALEHLEHTVMSMVEQALRDFLQQAVTIFTDDTDFPQDIAEDITQ